jgi:septum formation protein
MPTEAPFHLILASASPRRRQLLAEAGYRFDVVPPPVAEPAGRGAPVPPRQRAEALAYFKARAVANLHPLAWVLAADTLVVVGGEVLGKPADAGEAREMLRRLAGTRQAVITGVAMLGPAGYRQLASETTFVTMRAMDDDDLAAYVDSGEWRGKAGAYAIQETADRFVTSVEGSFTNVVGLPMERVGGMIGNARRRAASGASP